MATEVRRRRGTTIEHSTFTGAVAELTVDLTKDTVVVHDGATQGGFPLLREDLSNVPTTAPFTNISLDTAIFDTTYSADGNEAQGALYWNSDEETLSLVTNGQTTEIGQKVEVHVKNQTGAQINKGEVVYASGTVGSSGRITVAKMIADGTIAAKRVVGVAAENIADGADGKVVHFGKIRQLNTNSFNEGDILWVSTSTAGAFQNTEPVQADGDLALPIAFVVTKSINNGELFVRINAIDENEYQDYDAQLTTLSGLSADQAQDLVDITAAEYTQLQNIDTVTISNTQWGYLGELNQSLTQASSPTFGGLTVNGDVSVTGTVDGRDVSADGADLDELYTTIGLSALTSHEVDQLENIGDLITISNTQWTYLGELNQSLTTNTDVQFDDITLTGIVKTNEIDAQADLVWNTATEVFSTSDFYVNNAVNIGSNVYITDELDVAESLTVGTTLDVSGNATLGGTANISSNTTIGGTLTLTGAADFNSTMNLQGAMTTQNTIQSDNFSKGTGSTGWIVDGATGFAIEDNSGTYDMYVDSLTVRGSLRVFELIAKQISAIGGTEILSVANGTVESSSGSAGSETVTLEDPNNTLATSFADNDLILVQRFDPNDPSNLVKQEFRTVSVASGLTLTLTSTSGAPTPSTPLSAGDFIVAYGNLFNGAGRGNIIYRNVEGNPIVRLQSNIDSYSDFASPTTTTRVAYGDLNGFSGQGSGTYGFFAGTDNSEHVLIKSDGLFFKKDNSTVLAELTSNTFKVGGATNFLSFNGTDFDVQTDTFTLETTNLSINSTNELITIGSADSVSLGKKLNLSASSDIDYRDSLDKYASTVDFFGLYLNPENYFGFVQDNEDPGISDGYNFRVGGETSNYIEVNGATGDVDIKFDTFDLTSGNLRIKSGGTTYPSANTGNTSSAATTGNYSGVNVERLDLTINSGKWIKFQFDYDHNTSGTSNFQCDFTVEIQHEVSASWSSIGVSDDIFYLLNPSYAYVDVTAGASLSVTDDSTTSQTKLRFQSASASNNSYTGTITFYFYVFDKGSTDALRLNFIDNSTSINSYSTDIDGVEYNPVTELNPNGIFVRLADSLVNSNGNTYQDISLITNA